MNSSLDRDEPPQHFAELWAASLDTASPNDIVRWALEKFSPQVILACSFGGPGGMALIDMAVAIDSRVTVSYIDTDVLFSETYALIETVKRHYGIDPLRVSTHLSLAAQANFFGESLWSKNPDLCCALRKVLPQRDLLKNYDAWITGLRRDQSASRQETAVVEWDEKFGLYKINPLARWTEDDIWRYVREHNVPYNPLHESGYPSLGCTHCTLPVAPGENLRAGRWPGFTKTECGLHGGK